MIHKVDDAHKVHKGYKVEMSQKEVAGSYLRSIIYFLFRFYRNLFERAGRLCKSKLRLIYGHLGLIYGHLGLIYGHFGLI